MKIQSINTVPYSNRFDKSVAYIYWAISWWDEAGADASIFWEDVNGVCHYLAIGTGETSEPTEAKIYKDITISRKLFWELSQDLVKLGVLDIESPKSVTPSIAEDSYFYMKLKTGETVSYLVRGGITKDEKINKVDQLLGKFIRNLNQL